MPIQPGKEIPMNTHSCDAPSIFPPVTLDRESSPVYSVNVALPPDIDTEIRRYVEEDQWTSWTVMIHTALYSYRAHVWTREQLDAEFHEMIEEGIRSADKGESVEATPQFWKRLEQTAERHVKAIRKLEAEGKVGNLSLPKELYGFVKERISAKVFSTPTEVVCAAMPYLREYRKQEKLHRQQDTGP